MNKRVVWVFCLIIALLSVGSMLYRLGTPRHFDSAAWRKADDPGDFLDRRAMMSDLETFFANGRISTVASTEKYLGHPERTDDDNPHIWYYNLGGERSSSSPDSITWLELTFDSSERLSSHRQTQELIVPDPSAMPVK